MHATAAAAFDITPAAAQTSQTFSKRNQSVLPANISHSFSYFSICMWMPFCFSACTMTFTFTKVKNQHYSTYWRQFRAFLAPDDAAVSTTLHAEAFCIRRMQTHVSHIWIFTIAAIVILDASARNICRFPLELIKRCSSSKQCWITVMAYRYIRCNKLTSPSQYLIPPPNC